MSVTDGVRVRGSRGDRELVWEGPYRDSESLLQRPAVGPAAFGRGVRFANRRPREFKTRGQIEASWVPKADLVGRRLSLSRRGREARETVCQLPLSLGQPPGLTPDLTPDCEPRSRRRFPEEALSEGTRMETSLLRFRNSRPPFAKRTPAAESRPDFLCAAGPPRADEGNDDGSGGAFLTEIFQTRSLPSRRGSRLLTP